MPDGVGASLQLLLGETLPAGEGCSHLRMNMLKCSTLWIGF